MIWRWQWLFVAGSLMLIVSACDTPPDATATPTLLPITIMAPSATTNPILPTANNPEGGNVDANNFTPGASSGSLNATQSATQAAIQAPIPMTFVMPDGLVIAATYYGAVNHPTPAVLLLHQLGSNKEAWQGLANRLQAAGSNVLAIDLRGHGATGGAMDWAKAPADVSNVFAQLRTLPGVDSSRVSVIGASIGANLALGVCADTGQCRSMVLLSPGLDYVGIKTADAMTRYGAHPALIVASRGDNPSGADSPALDKLAKGDHKLQLYNGSVHGMALLDSQTDLTPMILKWLADH